MNKIIYKGYYYDEESGFYYCKSRYYDPKWGRWISPDSIEYLDPQSINGLNLYCYCGNDPINYCDPSGNLALWALALIGIATYGLINGTVNVITKTPEESAWGVFLGGFFEGAVSTVGLAAGLTIGTITGGVGGVIIGGTIAVAFGFAGGKYGNAISQKISYGNVDWGVANLNGVFAAIINLISYTGLHMNSDILSQSSKLGIRFLENLGPSTVGLGITGYIVSLPKPNLNEFRDEERIKSQHGRFIWEYLL